jgi:hypothetical protein
MRTLLTNPVVEGASILASVLLVAIFTINQSQLPAEQAAALTRFENSLSFYFLLEYAARAWANVGDLRYLTSPLMVVDLLNLVPFIVHTATGGALVDGSPLEPLRILRALRILRLRKYFERDEATRLVRAITRDPDAQVDDMGSHSARTRHRRCARLL